MNKVLHIRTRTTRNDWLKAVYANGLVRADESTLKLADKLEAARKFESLLGPASLEIFPKTLGLRDFMVRASLTPGSSTEEWRSALINAFPRDVILKPTAVINSGGETAGYFFGLDRVLFAVAHDDGVRNDLARSNAYVSDLLGRIVSGEEFILQENVPVAAGYVTSRAKTYSEIRIHTYEDRVMENAMYSRWAVQPVDGNHKFDVARELVQKFLDRLPKDDLKLQAWSLDVLVFDNDYARVIDLNTNRGLKVQWSGYLTRPELIGAYARLFELTKGVRFAGWQGSVIRNNWGNYLKYLKKYYVEGIR